MHVRQLSNTMMNYLFEHTETFHTLFFLYILKLKTVTNTRETEKGFEYKDPVSAGTEPNRRGTFLMKITKLYVQRTIETSF